MAILTISGLEQVSIFWGPSQDNCASCSPVLQLFLHAWRRSVSQCLV